MRDSDDDDVDDDDDSAAIAMAMAIDQSPGYVGCLVTKNTHRCSYDALACRHGQPNWACLQEESRSQQVERWMDVGWMCTILHTLGG